MLSTLMVVRSSKQEITAYIYFMCSVDSSQTDDAGLLIQEVCACPCLGGKLLHGEAVD